MYHHIRINFFNEKFLLQITINFYENSQKLIYYKKVDKRI